MIYVKILIGDLMFHTSHPRTAEICEIAVAGGKVLALTIYYYACYNLSIPSLVPIKGGPQEVIYDVSQLGAHLLEHF